MGLHRFLLLLDRFHQFELRPATIQVVPRTMNAEIRVAGQVVGQKSQSDGQRD
jgi:hypothetical protein